MQLSLARAENPSDKVRNNIHSLRAKFTAELKSAVAALQLSIARAENPCDEVRKNINFLRARLRAESNSDVVETTGRLLSIYYILYVDQNSQLFHFAIDFRSVLVAPI